MATDTQKYASPVEEEPRHSALAEFGRDERRPAVLLLSALLLSALFFGIGLMVGRWTATPETTREAVPSMTVTPPQTSTPQAQTATSPAANSPNEPATNASARRFALLMATYDSPEKAQALVKALQAAGYKEIRTSSPRPGENRPRYSVLVGRYTQEEAREAERQMRSLNNPQFRNAKVIESSGQ